MKNEKKFTREEKGLTLVILLFTVLLTYLSSYVYGIPFSVESSNNDNRIIVEIIELSANCNDCFNVTLLANEFLKNNNIKISSREIIDYNSQEGKQLIQEYNIQRVPALIIRSKEIEMLTIDTQVFSIQEEHAIFDKSVPYQNRETNDVQGVVELIEIQPDNCITCTSLSSLRTQFEQWGVKINDVALLPTSSQKAKQLIEENKLTFAPTLLISKDITEYWWLFDQIKVSLIEREDYFVFATPIAPYVNLSSGEKMGMVDITYVENLSCEDCFNVTLLRDALQKAGIAFNNEKHVNVSSSEGQALLKKYNITAIPTVLFSKEINDYVAIKDSLLQVGSFEEDGGFVFRKLETLNVKYQEIP